MEPLLEDAPHSINSEMPPAYGDVTKGMTPDARCDSIVFIPHNNLVLTLVTLLSVLTLLSRSNRMASNAVSRSQESLVDLQRKNSAPINYGEVLLPEPILEDESVRSLTCFAHS
jgi:hypothetical protein